MKDLCQVLFERRRGSREQPRRLGGIGQARFWSRGYSFESASAVLAHAQTVRGLKRIVSIVSPANAASIGLLGKLGFCREGLARLSEDGPDLPLFRSGLSIRTT